MTKAKNTIIPSGDVLLTTPLSVAECVEKLQNMAHFDLNVHIVRQSTHSAEVKFVERHNDDLPLYVTSRLMTTKNGTRVSFELSEYLRERTQQPREAVKSIYQNPKLAAALVFITMIFIMAGYKAGDLVAMGSYLLPVLLIGGGIVHEIEKTKYTTTPMERKQRSRKIKAIMHQRADVLKEDIIDALTIDSTEEQFDELGNAYYIEIADLQYGHA